MPRLYLGLSFAGLLLGSPSAGQPKIWRPLEEADSKFRLISFKDIPPTQYSLKAAVLEAEVKASSAAWLLPLTQPRRLSQLSFLWQAEGGPRLRDAASEASKAGDDALLRIGLIFAGAAPTLPFFAPAWIKAVRDTLHLPSSRMLYLVVGAQHAPGERWPSPYTDSIMQQALASSPEPKPEGKGWQRASYDAKPGEEIVGLWIMADGDNTGAQFKVRMKDLSISE